MISGWTAAVLALGACVALPILADAREPVLHRSYAVLTGTTSIPYGWVDFCSRYAGECDGPALPSADVTLTPKAWHEIERVNKLVNQAVTPTTDMDHWGVVDRWDYPTDGRGDCEDYALWKRKLLIEAGLPRQALLMTVVRDHADEGHAILTVKTDRGEIMLDNMTDAILTAEETGYRFVKRQSQEDPNVWQSIGAPAGPGPLFTAR